MKLRYLAIVIAITLLLLAAGCGKKAAPAQQQPTAPPAPAAPAPPAAGEGTAAEGEAAGEAEGVVEIPETEMGPGLVTTEALETGDYTQHSLLGEPQNADTELAKDYTAEPMRFSNFDCVKDEETGIRYITLKVTNTNADRPFMISPKGVSKGYDTYFLIRSLVDMDPGCQTEELAAGESTVCLKIGLDDERYGNPEGTNRLTIQSPDNDGKKLTEAVVVNCPA
ncbi:hypothetical protein KY359_02685 [Candidatus Woesearchaeota archaeon]|nr:hypothetical protein [Candidatus Woesearchaeota archaeon]